jgi:hypothetical protein
MKRLKEQPPHSFKKIQGFPWSPPLSYLDTLLIIYYKFSINGFNFTARLFSTIHPVGGKIIQGSM